MQRDLGIGLFLLIISSLLIYGAVGLGIGKTGSPGPGLVPLLLGLIIAACSLAIIIPSLKFAAKPHPQESPLFTDRAVLVIGTLILFGLVVEEAGFFICTFLATLVMLRANGVTKWSLLILLPMATCITIFLIFNIFLGVRLPLGIINFQAE